ncbi:hypothetical protein GCM10022393_17630 [Aquimarina addita]|uniref:Outer membrane protein beta-barrel domain-containing protein n=1 Tax=Aquimarina addita TaxID=870485 RepID=A0ABP6UL92_9FLAO
MKKIILSALALVAFTFANAQDTEQTATGKWLIEANTGFGAAHTANTGFRYYAISDDGGSGYNLGLEGGYFVMDNLALKVGLGYGSNKQNSDADSFSTFSYKIGAKYYVTGKIPLQVDYSGLSVKDADDNPSFLGLQAGYAIFLGDVVSIEPGVRYNLTLDDEIAQSVFQLNIGFAVHL